MFDLITGLIAKTGYLGVLLLMFSENLFPPIPSELIMPLAGFAAAKGELNVVLVIAAGTAGSLLGALPWYYVGKWTGFERLRRWAARHGRWFTITPEELDRARAWFDRHGSKAVFLGRLVPTVRTLISIPAGVADMPLRRLVVYSALGTAIWTSILALAGYLLEERYRAVDAYLNPVSNVVVGLILVYYLYRVLTFGHRRSP